MNYTIDETHENKRLDGVIAELSGLSRSKLQKAIKRGEVLLNDEQPLTKTLVQIGDVISVPDEMFDQTPAEKAGPLPELTVLYEDEDVLVIEKQAGLVVHDAPALKTQYTLVDALLNHCPQIAEVGDDPKRPGIVHRLDKQVSGVMIVAKTQAAFEHLKTQFQERSVIKEYQALIYGQPLKDHDTIDFKIIRSKTLGRMVARPQAQEGKEAITEYTVLDRFKTATLLQVFIHTGRTHQIRVHFKAIDHPVVGDPLYKKKQMKNIRPIALDRLFLHAHKLTITLPSGEEQTFTSPIPEELTALLEALPRT